MPKANDKIGPYTLISKLGRGAFGVVWLAEKRGLITTRFALKLPNEEEVVLAAVEKEASVWLHAGGHPNVLPIIEADIYDEQVVIVSEYAPDGSLSKWLEQHGGKAPSIESAVEMTLGILAGLEHLHKRGIIHRDLKPDNILLQNDTPRLADFGIARILKTTSNSTVATGTPAYMPPEAFDGKRSEQTDIWSVGVIFYQLLSGKRPFPQVEFTSLVGAILTKEPEPLPDSIPGSIRGVVERALQKNPGERYESASDMRIALRDAVQSRQTKTEILPQGVTELAPTIASPSPVGQFDASLSETQKIQLEYWTAFRDLLLQRNSFLKPPKPQPQNWFPVAIGRSNFSLVATTQRKGRRICAYLVMSGPEAKPHFNLLQRDKEAIEREIREPLDWRELPKGKESHVRLCQYKADPENRQDWERQHEWLKEKLELFHKVFAPRIKYLNASDYVADNQNAEEQIPRSTVASSAVAPQNPLSPSSFEAKPQTESHVQPARKSNWLLWVTVSVMALVIIGFAVTRLFSPKVANPQSESNYSIDSNRFNAALELFYREQFRAAREEWMRSDPARRDARTQFYIAYAFYREGWGRIYNDSDLFKQGLESVNQTINLSPNSTIVVDDPALQIHTAAELKAELEMGLEYNSKSKVTLDPFRKRK